METKVLPPTLLKDALKAERNEITEHLVGPVYAKIFGG